MKQQNKILLVFSSDGVSALNESINKQMELIPQYRVVSATTVVFQAPGLLVTIVLELVTSSDQVQDSGSGSDASKIGMSMR